MRPHQPGALLLPGRWGTGAHLPGMDELTDLLSGDGHLVAAYPVHRVIQKGVYRRDLGDLDPLADSIRRLGLLTPLVVTGDGHLLCGRRRLSAVRHLGWETVPVWIPSKVSRLLRTVAMFDDEALHKPLTLTEQAALYDEYQRLYATEASLRQQATRFRAGDAESPPPGGDAESDLPGWVGPARVHAALAVTGRRSYNRLAEIRELRRIANNRNEDQAVRALAAQAAEALDRDGRVHPRWLEVKTRQALAALTGLACDADLPEATRAAASQVVADVGADTSEQAWRIARGGLAAVKGLTQPGLQPGEPDAKQKREIDAVTRIMKAEMQALTLCPPDVFWAVADQDQKDLMVSWHEGVTGWMDKALAARIARWGDLVDNQGRAVNTDTPLWRQHLELPNAAATDDGPR